MVIGSCKVFLRAEWAKSLKDKRMIIKSIIDRTKNKFNVSIAEVDLQDIHQSIVIGFACVTNDASHANSIIDNIINYIDRITDAVIEDVEIEIL